jgi:transposase
MYATELRKVAVRLVGLGFSCRRVAFFLNISKSSVQRWMFSPTIKKRCLKASPIPSHCIESLVENHPFLTVTGYQQRLKEEFTVRRSRVTVWRWLRKAGFRVARTYPGGMPSEALSERREAFCRTIENINRNDVIAVDETSFYSMPIPRRGWRRHGGRLTVPLVRTTGRRHSLIVAVTRQGFIHYMLKAGSINTATFIEFVHSIPSTWTHSHLLMDNVAFHKSVVVRKTLEDRGISPLYTSPYSPDWNPAEMLFSIMKRNQRKRPMSGMLISEDARCLIADIPESMCSNWFDHCWKNLHARHHP